MGGRPSKKKNKMETSVVAQLPPTFEVQSYKKYIEECLKTENTAGIVSCITSCTREQRLVLCDDTYSCQANLPETDSQIIKILLSTPVSNTIQEIQRLHKEHSSSRFIEILFGITGVPLTDIIHQYLTQLHSPSLQQCITDLCNNDVIQELALVTLNSATSDEAQQCAADKTADLLVEAAQTQQLFLGEKVFISVLRQCSTNEMSNILELFLRKCQRDMNVEVDKCNFDDGTKQQLKIIVSLLQNKDLYTVNALKERLSDPDQHLWVLLLLCVQGEESLKSLKQIYRNTHFDGLAADIRDKVEHPIIQQAMLKIIK